VLGGPRTAGKTTSPTSSTRSCSRSVCTSRRPERTTRAHERATTDALGVGVCVCSVSPLGHKIEGPAADSSAAGPLSFRRVVPPATRPGRLRGEGCSPNSTLAPLAHHWSGNPGRPGMQRHQSGVSPDTPLPSESGHECTAETLRRPTRGSPASAAPGSETDPCGLVSRSTSTASGASRRVRSASSEKVHTPPRRSS
jgi:hypothetical protein